MSYQQSYNRAVSNPVNGYNPSPQSSLHRKPATYTSSLRSVSPLPPSSNQQSSPSTTQYQNQNNHLHSPTPQTSLNSFPPGRSPISPSITPDIPSVTQPEPDRLLYSSPITRTSSNNVPQPQIQTRNSTSSNLRLLNTKEIEDALVTCLRLQTQAVDEFSKRPFYALLLAPDNVSVLATHSSLSHYQHAESELARLAAAQYPQNYLEKCTLVSTWEPCAMCAGTIYWAGIGRVLYATSETRLKELTGTNNNENMTMSLPCRTVLEAGQRHVEVVGPISTMEGKVLEESGKWWKQHQPGQNITGAENGSGRSTSSVKENGSIHSKRTSVSIYNPDDSLLGSIGEDGEYQADLKVDWMS